MPERPATQIPLYIPDNRPEPDIIRYNPARDLAYLHADVLNEVAYMMTRENMGLSDFEKIGIFTDDDTQEGVNAEAVEAIEALKRYLHFCRQPEVETPIDAIDRSGWMQQVSPRMRIVILSLLGVVIFRHLYPSIRETDDGSVRNTRHLRYDKMDETLRGLTEAFEERFEKS